MMLSVFFAAALSCQTPSATLQDLLFGPPAGASCAADETATVHAAAVTRILAGRTSNEVYLDLDAGDGRSTSLLIAACVTVHGDPDRMDGIVPPIVCDNHALSFDLTARGLAVWDEADRTAPTMTIALPAEVVSVNGHLRPTEGPGYDD